MDLTSSTIRSPGSREVEELVLNEPESLQSEPTGTTPLTTDRIRRVYGGGAKNYDEVMRTAYAGMVDRQGIMAALAPEPGEKILEVGIGTGANLPYYPSRIDLEGTDLTPEMLAVAQQKRDKFKGAKLKLSVHNTEDLPFENDSFDRVLATLTICVTPDPRRALREVWRVARAGARIVLYELAISSNPNVADIQRILIRDHVMSIGCPLPTPDYPDGIIVWDPCRDFAAMTDELGFEHESIEWFETNNPVLARCLLCLRIPITAG